MEFFNRTGENLNRKKIKIISQTPEEIIADIERYDNPENEGTKIDAETFNQFQREIDTANNNSTNAINVATTANDKSDEAITTANSAKSIADGANTKSNTAISTSNTASNNASTAVDTANTALSNSQQAVSTANTASQNATTAVSTANEAKDIAEIAETKSTSADSKSTTALNNSNTALSTANTALSNSQQAITDSLYAKNKATEVESKLADRGATVKIGTSSVTEVTFTSDPQTQITANKSLADSNKTRVDGHDTEITKIKNNTTIIANTSGGFSCGSGATNGTGLQFKGFTVCDANGKVPVARLLDAIYPVGSIYFSTSSTNPGTLFGGTWEAFATGRTIIGNGTSDQTFSAGSTGGASTHTLTIAQMPSHTHTQNSHSHKFNKATQNEWSGSVISGYTANARYLGWVEQGNGGGDNYQYTSGKGIYASYPEAAVNQNTGGGTAHNNLQPYIVTYIWKRTA